MRAATVLGVIGASGIGQVLFETVRGFYDPQACAILVVVVLSVSVMDPISQTLRRRVA